MAFLLSNLKPSMLPQSKSKEKPIHLTLSSAKPISQYPLLFSFSSPLATLHSFTAQVALVNTAPGVQEKHQDEFYVNVGLAVRTLREDMPLIFMKDLNYNIYRQFLIWVFEFSNLYVCGFVLGSRYFCKKKMGFDFEFDHFRDDVTFIDPLNTFTGIEKYKLIFWALRFHGKILFREIALDVFRIWQPSENVILIRWNLRGVPRVPWEAKGEFQGTSRYKLDRNGKIYEHKVDNLAFNFPQTIKSVSVFDLVTACSASPNPSFSWGPLDSKSSSWIEFYQAVKNTMHQEGRLLQQYGLATCS